MYKVVSELVYFPHNVFVPRTTTLRSSSKLLYYQPFAHTNTLLHSFVPKTFYAWNNLPGYITHGKTLSLKKMCGPKGLSLNQPWLPQLQFKTTILYNRSIWEAFRGYAKCRVNCFSSGNIQVNIIILA